MRATSLLASIAALWALGTLGACGSVLERPFETARAGAGRSAVGAPGRVRSEPPEARTSDRCGPLPTPPPMEPPGVVEPSDGGPIPAPCGPPPRVEWPAPVSLGGARAACSAPGPTGLPAEVTDVSNPRPWALIVLHHSAGRVGGAARFDEMHKAKGWDGVGYDFVIGNGSDTQDGALETTIRWTQQRGGAHAKGWNELGIGICLVGNFEETDPTPAQMDTLRILVRHLRGRFSIPRERIVGHGQLLPTKCPGARFSVPELAASTDPVHNPVSDTLR